MDITIGILSGGKSRRMGRNKAFLPYQDTTFLDHLLEQLGNYSEILISVDLVDNYQKYRDFCVVDENLEIGPIEGIRQILKKSSQEVVFIGAVDMPYLSAQAVEYLKTFLTAEYDCCVAKAADGIHPLCGLYRKSMLELIESAIEAQQYRIASLFDQCRTRFVPLDMLDRVLENVNSPADYARIIK